MNFPRKVSLLFFLLVIAAIAAHIANWDIPTLRWFFSFSSETASKEGTFFTRQITVATLLLSIVSAVAIWLWIIGNKFEWNPITIRRFRGFRSIGRGYVSFQILCGLVFLAMLDQALVGRDALIVKYKGEWHFPAFVKNKPAPGSFGTDPNLPIDYRELQTRMKADKSAPGFVMMPLIPWDSTFDTEDLEQVPLVRRDGVYYRGDDHKPYQGLATSFHKDNPKIRQIEATFRKGKPHGNAMFFDLTETPLGQRDYDNGVAKESAEASNLSIPDDTAFQVLEYPPTPPTWKSGHLLGTDHRGWDVAAQLYGGFQVVIKASILYVAITFFIGIAIGLASGFFGGTFDLIAQRVIEVLQNMPFLLIVMIIAARVGRENVSIVTIVFILCLFSWIGISHYKRTAALKEKARDYVAAARVLGAGTTRILFKHILPNALATSITMVPFTVTAIATSLTALDFLGFGLPDKYPSWGILLDSGVENLEAPWIVSSVFVMLFLILLLITFVGEAIREAFDPKKFTTYQ